jgi:uncharacterized protein
MTLATVIYGSRGSGKTSLAAVFAEEVSKAGQRFCAIDLKGDLYGLKSTADGKGDGIPVVIFGGDHQDVPLEDGAGAFVGETVAGLGQSCVLDLEYFSKGKQVRFLAAFFEALYDRNRDPLLLILDEGQRYAPQRPIDPDAAKCLGAVEDLVKLGRKHGIGPVILTQRGSGLNKEVSELCDMMVAFRTPGPLDQERIKDWLDANTTKVQRDEVMGQLSGLPTGTAVFASGHPDLKIFGVYPVRRRETFDSSATPKVGQRRKEPKRFAKPDLDELKSKMSAAIERQKADDPKALRARIGELEREVKAKIAPAAIVKAPKVERVDVPVLSGADRKLLTHSGRWATRWATTAEEIAAAAKKWTEALAAIDARIAAVTGKPAPRFLPAPLGQPKPCAKHSAPALAKKSAPSNGVGKTTDGVTPARQKILNGLAFVEQVLGSRDADRDQLAFLSEQSPTSSSYANNLGALRSANFIDYPAQGRIALTDAGRALAVVENVPATSAELHAIVQRRLPPARWRILATLINAYPREVDRAELAELSVQSPMSSSYANNLGALRSLGLLDYPSKGSVIATPALFLEGR